MTDARILYGNSNPVRVLSGTSLSNIRIHQTVKLIVDVKLSGISGPTPAAFTLRVISGYATVYSRKQAVTLSASMNGPHSFRVDWTPTRSGFDQLIGIFLLGGKDKHAVSPPFAVTTCQSPTVHGIECLGRGPFSQYVPQGPDTPYALAGPVGGWPLVPTVRIVSRIRTVQHNPAITVIFWGAQWHHHHRIMAQLLSFYSRLRGSAYNAALSQYNNAGNNPTLIGAWIDPAPPLGVAGVSPYEASSEGERISRLTGLTLNPSAQVIVMLPPGISNAGPTKSSGAYHGPLQTEAESKSGVNRYVAHHGLVSVFRWLPGLEPSEYGAVFTEAASHEWTESVTDPNPDTGFVDVLNDPLTNLYGHEIADVCRVAGFVVRNGLTLTRFYSVKAKACIAPP